MLATLGPVQEGEGWAYEFKWDGVRAVTAVTGDELRVQSRNDKPMVEIYLELGELRGLVDQPVVLDGEVVALDEAGRPDFGLLQSRMGRHSPDEELMRAAPVLYYVFDVLHLDGEDLTRVPYRDRRKALDGLKLDGRSVKVPPWFVDVEGATVQAAAAEHGLEGVVAKRISSRYEPGKRSRSWIKTPLRKNTEVIVGGWAPGQGRRAGTLGALLLGVPSEGGLRFIGNVGTGFTDAMLADLFNRLAELKQPASPFAEPVPREFARQAHWVAPELVAEVEYRSISRDGRLRHPSWRGLRPDKSPSDLRTAL
ncbi:MAG: bifunctional non-ous end joining protein LigD [Pseudonocardiales bacterium]|jgi:bifunctional non-homologous end joining protein LigD|nr:bifunctional non-ous end joining protein LigD [Pseudonocardiales bacterium]